jgi:integrase
VAEHLHNWLDGYVRTNCSQRTLDGYRSIIEHHIIPAIGQIQLKQLNSQAIQNYYSQACEGLSARTVHHQHRVLSQSLKYAMRQGYLGRNPAELVDPPKPLKKQMRALETNEAKVLLEVAQGSYYYPIIYTALSSGLRQAELLGLRWRDVDLDYMTISVNQVLYKRCGVCQFKTPKTNTSRRSVNMTPKLAIYLRDYRESKQALYNRILQPFNLDTLVFSTLEGQPIDPAVLGHNFHKIAVKAGLGNVRFHDLRHSFASLMLKQGVSPKVISSALGHASVAFTMDTYSHILNGMQDKAMELLNEVLPEGVSQKSNANLTLTQDIMLSVN